MAEDVEKKEGEENASAPTTSRSKKMIIGGALALVLLAVGAPLGYFLSQPSAKPEPKEEVDKVPEATEVVPEEDSEAFVVNEDEEVVGAIVPFDTFLVNLSGGKYLRVQLQAEFVTPDVPKRLYARMVPIRDEIIALLTQKTAGELEDISGKDKLKGKVVEIMNTQLRREDVRRVYFTQFVIQ
jgi:flagellar FliL protein